MLPSCIELRKSIGHKVNFFAIFNFLVFALSTVKIKSAKCVIFAEILHRYLKPCIVQGIWNAAGKLDMPTSKLPVPTFCQLLPPGCALGLTMHLKNSLTI